MPRSGDADDRSLVEAVRAGRLDERVLDQAVERMLTLIDRCVTHHRTGEEFDRGQQHHLARKIARESMVLLKNEENLLPIRGNKRVAFIGLFAKKPRYQGGGSSHINAAEELSALDAVRSVSPVRYAQGYVTDRDEVQPELEREAVEAAREADVTVLFLGLPDAFESEGYDRTHMRLPACQLHLLDEVARVQKKLVVVLHNGAPVEMPWADKAGAILEAYLGGQAAGGATVDLLFGAVSPCAKLAETFPMRLEDTPCYLTFPGEKDRSVYSEDVFVGYRYYDKRKMPVRFPFGHGLSYTTFAYSNLRLSTARFAPGQELTVSVDVTNTGSMAAKEIVQFYVRPVSPVKNRPVRELKGFDKIALAPGETGTVTVTLDSRAFAYWEDTIHDWYVEGGEYAVEAAASSRDIRLTETVAVENRPLPVRVTMDTTLGDLMTIPGASEALGELAGRITLLDTQKEETTAAAQEAISTEMQAAMMRDMTVHSLCSFSGGALTRDDLQALVDRLNRLQK